MIQWLNFFPLFLFVQTCSLCKTWVVCNSTIFVKSVTSLDPPFWGHHSEEEASGNRKSDIHEGEENGTKSAPYQVNTHTSLPYLFGGSGSGKKVWIFCVSSLAKLFWAMAKGPGGNKTKNADSTFSRNVDISRQVKNIPLALEKTGVGATLESKSWTWEPLCLDKPGSWTIGKCATTL